jgi:glycosyltransferase involved in cell wall biosynthesis
VEGFVVTPDDADALAKALISLAGEPDRVARMGEAARARVLEGFTERHVMNDLKRLYAALLRS